MFATSRCARRLVYSRAFTDRVRLQVVGGRGGAGRVSFESLDNVRKRPVGGHGGRGEAPLSPPPVCAAAAAASHGFSSSSPALRV